MSYEIERSNPNSNTLFLDTYQIDSPTRCNGVDNSTISLSCADNARTSIHLFGDYVPDYGLLALENFTWLLENFSNASPPVNAIKGQLWHKSDEDVVYMYVGADTANGGDSALMDNWKVVAYLNREDQMVYLDAVSRSGDTMYGDLEIAKPNPSLFITDTTDDAIKNLYAISASSDIFDISLTKSDVIVNEVIQTARVLAYNPSDLMEDGRLSTDNFRIYHEGHLPTPVELGVSPDDHNHDGIYLPVLNPALSTPMSFSQYGKNISFDNDKGMITVSDGYGNLNLKSGINEFNDLLSTSSSASHIALSGDTGTVTLYAYSGLPGSHLDTSDANAALQIKNDGTITFNSHKVYHAGDPPTHDEVGASPFDHTHDLDYAPLIHSHDYDTINHLTLNGVTKFGVGEGLWIESDPDYFGNGEDARLLSIIDTSGNNGYADGGLVIQGKTITDGITEELLRIRSNNEFKWKGHDILHKGIFDVSQTVIFDTVPNGVARNPSDYTNGIYGVDAYNSPDVMSPYSTGYVSMQGTGTRGVQHMTHWNENGGLPSQSSIRIKDSSSSNWSGWRDLAWDDAVIKTTGGTISSGDLGVTSGNISIGNTARNSTASLTITTNSANKSLILLTSQSQGTAEIVLEQESNHGAGLIYNGDDNPDDVGSNDWFYMYRKELGIKQAMLGWYYTHNYVTFFDTPSVNGSTVWHAGNDGPGSGLHADLLDGYHTGPTSGNMWGIIPVVQSNGVMEVGRYIDFHESDTDVDDYDGRLYVSGTELYYTKRGNSAKRVLTTDDLASIGTIISKAENGYWKDTSTGMIIQWGTAKSIGDEAYRTVTFPVSFPSACRSFTATPITTGFSVTPVSSVNTSSARIRHIKSGSSTTINAYWIAVGY